ncbi:MAG: DUF1552 domain-containing protein [Verrucomicrobiota bacterium]
MQRRSRFDLSRRGLLKSLGIGAAASPLIPLLNASAQTATRPKRLLLLYTPDGMAAQNFNTTVDWKPTGTETDFTFQMIHAPLEPFKAKITVPWGLTLTAGGAGEPHAYGMAGLWSATTLPAPNAGASFDGGNGHLTGWGAAPTIDQLIAAASGPNMPYQRSPTDASPETRYRSIALGVACQGANTLNRMTYTAVNAPIHPEVNAKAAFDRIFAGVTPGGGGGTTPAAEDPVVARNRMEQKALVDILKGDLTRIKTRVGSADYQKIEAHLHGVSEMERRLTPTNTTTSPPAAGCTIGTAPTTGATFPVQVTQMMDIITHAFACDVTRVMTLQLSYAFSHLVHTWLGHTSGHHDMSHDGKDRRVELQAIDNWYAKQVAYLLQQLDSVNEGNGTLLDNTLIVWGRELGSTAHRMDRSPLLLMGKAGGALKTGRFLNFDKQEHVKLLVSVMQLMGMSSTMSVGNRVMNSGPLTGLV